MLKKSTKGKTARRRFIERKRREVREARRVAQGFSFVGSVGRKNLISQGSLLNQSTETSN